MKNKNNLLVRIKNILKEIRFGNLSSRLSYDFAQADKEFVNDFNNMLESLQDRERMLNENQGIFLAKSEYLNTLLNMLNEGVISTDKDLNILSVNQTQACWFNKKQNKLLGKNLFSIIRKYNIYNETCELLEKNDKSFFEKDKKNCILTFEFRKSKMTFSITVKKFLDKDKNLNYFIIAKDISSDIKLQKLKDTFIATMTHDLKVPIVAEEKVLKLLLSEALGSTSDIQKEAINNMLSNNKDMKELVTTLLDVYKLDDGVFKINKSYFDIQNIIEKEIEKIKFLANENDIKIKLNTKLSNKEVFADKTQIARVITNLLSNAINFAPQNTDITIKIFDESNKVYISITDKGGAISPENLPYIFDRYFTKKYRKVGTGLGLYLSKEIINLHNGNIKAECIPNKKTTFTIELPY